MTSFHGPYAGINPIVTISAHPGYSGYSDPSILNPKSPAKANPFRDADARKWDPRLTVLNRPPIPLSSKKKPDDNSGSTWTYDTSDTKMHAESRPAERYSKEQLSSIFKEPGNGEDHHRQADYHEILVQPERGYRRGRDPEKEIYQRSQVHNTRNDDIKSVTHHYSPRSLSPKEMGAIVGAVAIAIAFFS